MQTNSKDTERWNGYQPLWLPLVDLIDTITMPSCENYEVDRRGGENVSYMNMRNGSVVSFTISRRGNKSFAMGVAVCLRESVYGEG